MENSLSPLFKWTGGKRKEIKVYEKYIPKFKNYIEPFFGGGATYWYLNNTEGINVINDLEVDIIHFLKNVKDQNTIFLNTLREIRDGIKKISDDEKSNLLSISEAKTERGKYFYKYRQMDREPGLDNLTSEERSIRFFIVNQHSFNGMRRFNAKGYFNVPYGNYKNLNIDLLTSKEHINLLRRTKFKNEDFENLMIDSDDTFIFLDPPYTNEFKEYTHGDSFTEKDQIRLGEKFKSLKKSKAMLVINDSELIRKLYNGYIKEEYDLKYGTNIKSRYDTNAKHLIICNY